MHAFLVGVEPLFRPLFTFDGLVAVLGLLLLSRAYAWHRRMERASQRKVPIVSAPPAYPSVTIVRPVRGADDGAAENFRAALDTGYPGEIETLFVFDDEDDPGLPIARAIVETHTREGRRGSAQILIAGPPPRGRTGKLNAMVRGAWAARGELVGFGDSDTRPDRVVLTSVVEALLSTPRAGAGFAPVAVYQPPIATGDALYALMLNALYSPLAAETTEQDGGLPFIMGQLMVFRREALVSIGGIESADGQLVDDMYLGRRLHEAGWVNVMSRAPLHIANSGMTLRAFVPVFQRWMMFSRTGLPLSFTWRQWLTGLRFYAAILLSGLALAADRPLVALAPLSALLALGASLLYINRRYGGAKIPARLAWTGWGVLLIGSLIALANLFRRSVTWRGRQYALDRAAALAPATGPADHGTLSALRARLMHFFTP